MENSLVVLPIRRSGGGGLFSDHGPSSMLHVVQMARVFADSKTFVDMKVSGGRSPADVLDHFDSLMGRYSPAAPPREEVRQFVRQNFTMENQMEEHEPEVRQSYSIDRG